MLTFIVAVLKATKTFTHPHVISNQYGWLSFVEYKRKFGFRLFGASPLMATVLCCICNVIHWGKKQF